MSLICVFFLLNNAVLIWSNLKSDATYFIKYGANKSIRISEEYYGNVMFTFISHSFPLLKPRLIYFHSGSVAECWHAHFLLPQPPPPPPPNMLSWVEWPCSYNVGSPLFSAWWWQTIRRVCVCMRVCARWSSLTRGCGSLEHSLAVSSSEHK